MKRELQRAVHGSFAKTGPLRQIPAVLDKKRFSTGSWKLRYSKPLTAPGEAQCLQLFV